MWLLLACTAPETGEFTVYAPPELGLAAFLSTIGDARIVVVDSSDPEADAATSTAPIAVAVTTSDCGECYTLAATDGHYSVVGGAPLGVRYGVSALLESFGWRFHHPTDTWLPAELGDPDTRTFGEHTPDVDRRGLHLHTLHPIDGLYAYWTGESPERAAAITDWAVRNRANHLQWVGLDDITGSPSRLAEWQADTADIVDHAHAQGLTVGLGIQLFGTSNLQLAFDLVDDPADVETMRAEMEPRVASIAAIDWDVLNLSFGEFSGVEPADFIEAVDLAADVIYTAAPEVEITATIHVGNYEDLQVEWEGETLQYYFLVKYADPRITPWVHSVMYYNLVEDAGGAYNHDLFTDHRAFLEEKLAAGEPVGYFPETAYWVAFDDSVPTWLPLYVRSRWEDLRAFPELEDHVLFSTGWEWGYWQNDVAALRMSWETPDDWSEQFDWMFAPIDPALAETAIAFTEAQHTHLLEGRLAPWLAGRDEIIDLGDRLGIIAAPDRPDYDALLADPAAAAALLVKLDAMAADFVAVAAPTGDDRYSEEMADGVRVTTLRARFAAQLVRTVADPAGAPSSLSEAASLLDEARARVQHRHSLLHDDVDGRLTVPGENPSIYQFGYLRWADELCYWDREYAQVSNLVAGTDLDEPGCSF
jgi:hypothetical protein